MNIYLHDSTPIERINTLREDSGGVFYDEETKLHIWWVLDVKRDLFDSGEETTFDDAFRRVRDYRL